MTATGPTHTVRDILDVARKTRTADVEIALADFTELTPAEQLEFLLVGVLLNANQLTHHELKLTAVLKSLDRRQD